MNQFDNAKFFQHCNTLFYFDNQLMDFINYTHLLIEHHFPYLIMSDKKWAQVYLSLLYNTNKYQDEKAAIMLFKLKYLRQTEINEFNDHVLFICINYDIARLSNILDLIIKGDKQNKLKDFTFSIDSFVSLYQKLHEQINNIIILDNAYYNTPFWFNKFIKIRVVLPIYSIIIPIFIKKRKLYYRNYYLQLFIKDYIERYNSIDALDINPEYTQKMKSYIILVQKYLEDQIIQKPNKQLLQLWFSLIPLKLKSLNKTCINSILNYIVSNSRCNKNIILNTYNMCNLTNKQKQLIQFRVDKILAKQLLELM